MLQSALASVAEAEGTAPRTWSVARRSRGSNCWFSQSARAWPGLDVMRELSKQQGAARRACGGHAEALFNVTLMSDDSAAVENAAVSEIERENADADAEGKSEASATTARGLRSRRRAPWCRCWTRVAGGTARAVAVRRRRLALHGGGVCNCARAGPPPASQPRPLPA